MAKQKCERYSSGAFTCDPGSDYDREEIAFMKAMDQYKRDNRRPYPTWSEALSVLRALGWRLVAEPTEMPSIRHYKPRKQGNTMHPVHFSKPR